MTEVDPRLTVIYDPEFIKKLKKLIEQDEELHIAPSKVWFPTSVTIPEETKVELHNIKTALVDMDILVYRSGFAVERTEVDSHGSKINVVEPLENAIYLVNKTLEKISDRTKCTGMVGFLSGSTNFRDKIAVTRKYKDRPSRKPVHYDALREHFLQFDGIYEVEGQEADDALGIHQKEDTCICTIDKDLDQVPGWHYNFVKDEGYFINEHEGQYHFHKQWLVGDSVDSIPGCPGIGLVRAKKILDKCGTPRAMQDAVFRTYRNQFMEKVDDGTLDDYILEQARLVYIRRKEGEMWEPMVDED